MWITTAKFLTELLFPSFCLGCKREGAYLCMDCQSVLEISEYHYCLCGKNPARLPNGGQCYRCQGHALSGLYFALPYKEKPLTRKLIYQYKYEPYLKDLAGTFASLLTEHFAIAGNNAEYLWTNAVLVPVPLEKSRLKSRGYNQAEELAKALAHVLEIPVVTDSLVKIKKTAPQAELSAKAREKNLQGVFAMKNPAGIAGKKVFLVDDVYTTGSTMSACAHVLRTSGAKSVWGIAIAREG